MPWFGGVRGIWYRKDEFTKAGISAPPATWAQLVSDAKLLMIKYPGTHGLGAPSNFSNGIVSFIWGAGGQVAVQQGGKWVAQLNSTAAEAGLKFYADLYLTQHVSPAKYIGQTELGAPGATSGGSDEDFAKGTLDMYIDGPWAQSFVEVVPPANIAVGAVPWGLGSWVPQDSVRRITMASVAAGPAGIPADDAIAGSEPGPLLRKGAGAEEDRTAELALAAAAGRSLVIVVRDAHRYPAARDLVCRLLAARPDAVVVEMGLPVWRPPSGGHVATYGAARTSSQAAAEVLGLACR